MTDARLPPSFAGPRPHVPLFLRRGPFIVPRGVAVCLRCDQMLTSEDWDTEICPGRPHVGNGSEAA